MFIIQKKVLDSDLTSPKEILQISHLQRSFTYFSFQMTKMKLLIPAKMTRKSEPSEIKSIRVIKLNYLLIVFNFSPNVNLTERRSDHTVDLTSLIRSPF